MAAPLPAPDPPRMSREEYRRWAEAQPRGRFERVAGEVVAMAPERVAHNRVKLRVWQALDAAIRDGRIKQGDMVMLEAMGGGFTWGASLLRL